MFKNSSILSLGSSRSSPKRLHSSGLSVPSFVLWRKDKVSFQKALIRGRAAIWCRHKACCVPQHTTWLGERSSAETLRPLDLATGLAPEVVLCQGKPRSHLHFNLDPTFEDTFFFFLRKWSTQRALWAWWVWSNRPAKRLCCFFWILNVIGNSAPTACLDKEIFYSKTSHELRWGL